MSSTCSVLPAIWFPSRLRPSKCARPQTLLTMCTFPVRNRWRTGKGPPDGKPTPNAET